ncbi:MAG TPA: hypothetical protein VHD83_16150 [Puia sp.]|nr:hypothetical protein [Puia sp.]
MKPTTRITALIFFGALLCADPLLGQPINASAELNRLLSLDESARKAGDSIGRLKIALQYRDLLHDGGNGVLATAHAYAVVRDSAKAFEALDYYASLGLSGKQLCSGEDKKFSWLAGSPRFLAICQRIQENERPLRHSDSAVVFPESGYLPEDIDYDKQGRSFLFTSILQHAVFRLALDGHCRLFASSPSGWPMMAIKVDNRRGLVWVTEVAIPGFGGLVDSIKGQSAVCCFDARTGTLKERLPAPEGSQWGDMVLDLQGDPIVSDGQSGAIFRRKKGNWERIDKGDFISPQTPALSEDGKHLIVPDHVRGLAVMDIENGDVVWIRQSPEHPCAFNGVDGVYLINNRLLLTQNGVYPERVLEIRLDKDRMHPTGSLVIERATPGLGEPTHGVVVDGFFYYIANSGWNAVDEHGGIKQGAQMSQPVLMRYEL